MDLQSLKEHLKTDEQKRFKRERSNPFLTSTNISYPTFTSSHYTISKKTVRFYQSFKRKPSKQYCPSYQTPS